MKDLSWFWRRTRLWISFLAVVVEQQFGQFRKEVNEIEPTARVSLTNPLFWDIVTTPSDPRTDARDVELDAAEAYIRNSYFNALGKCLIQEARDSLST